MTESAKPYDAEAIEAIRLGWHSGRPAHSPSEPYSDISVIAGLLATLTTLRATLADRETEIEGLRKEKRYIIASAVSECEKLDTELTTLRATLTEKGRLVSAMEDTHQEQLTTLRAEVEGLRKALTAAVDGLNRMCREEATDPDWVNALLAQLTSALGEGK